MDNVEKIKSRLDIVELIQGYLKLQKAGINFKARCPFHNEKTPSFVISPERQIWHCFGCGKGGDHFGFIKEIEGVEFSEALRILAQRAGIELEQYNQKAADEKSRLVVISGLAQKFYIKQLFESTTGKKALEYLKDRGFKLKTIKEWELGFAPAKPNSLSRFLEQAGYTGQEIRNAGLSISAHGKVFDRFQSRITFPINDINGRPVGFTGRIYGAADNGRFAKYINTPQTLIYDKGNLLYGLDKAKADIKREGKCVVVEGNTDVIMSHQAGAANVVASSGTALTENQLKIVKRYTENLVLSFDQDEAGIAAMKRGVDLALQTGFNVSLLDLGDGELKDPADMIKVKPAMWTKALEQPKSVIQFYFDKTFTKHDSSTAEGKKNISNVLLPLIKNILNKVEQAHWVTSLSSRLKVREEVLWRQMEVTSVTPIYVKTEETVNNVSERRQDILEETLLSILLRNLKLAKSIKQIPKGELSGFTKEVVEKIKKASAKDFKFDNFVKLFMPDMALQLEFVYLKSQQLWDEYSDEQLEEQFEKVLNQFSRRSIVSKLTGLEFDIREAEELKDSRKIKTLLTQFNDVTQQLVKLG